MPSPSNNHPTFSPSIVPHSGPSSSSNGALALTPSPTPPTTSSASPECPLLPSDSLVKVVSAQLGRALEPIELAILHGLSSQGVAKVNHDLLHGVPLTRTLYDLKAVFRRQQARRRVLETHLSTEAKTLLQKLDRKPTIDEIALFATASLKEIKANIAQQMKQGESFEMAIEDLALRCKYEQLASDAAAFSQTRKLPTRLVLLAATARPSTPNAMAPSMARLSTRKALIGLSPVVTWFRDDVDFEDEENANDRCEDITEEENIDEKSQYPSETCPSSEKEKDVIGEDDNEDEGGVSSSFPSSFSSLSSAFDPMSIVASSALAALAAASIAAAKTPTTKSFTLFPRFTRFASNQQKLPLPTSTRAGAGASRPPPHARPQARKNSLLGKGLDFNACTQDEPSSSSVSSTASLMLPPSPPLVSRDSAHGPQPGPLSPQPPPLSTFQFGAGGSSSNTAGPSSSSSLTTSLSVFARSRVVPGANVANNTTTTTTTTSTTTSIGSVGTRLRTLLRPIRGMQQQDGGGVGAQHPLPPRVPAPPPTQSRHRIQSLPTVARRHTLTQTNSFKRFSLPS